MVLGVGQWWAALRRMWVQWWGEHTHAPNVFARNITESFNFLCVKRW